MLEHNTPAPVQGTAPISTSIDPSVIPGPTGAGAPATEQKQPEKPESVGDTLRGELAKAREAEAKEKAEPAKADADGKGKEAEAKDAPKADAEKAPKVDEAKAAKVEEPADKAAKGEAEKPAVERAAPDDRQSEGRKHSEPPARFLPEARVKWPNVPNEVKAEFHRVSQEYEAEVTQYKQSHEEWQKLSKFDQMAKQHNTSVSDALERYTAVDGLLNSNPIEGIRRVLETIGLTPQQYAQHVTQNPQAHQQRAPDPMQRQQPQSMPEIAELRKEIESLRSERLVEQTVPIIQAFAGDHPDYHALEPKIADILGSGVIEKLYGTGLSPAQKLAEAYRMAGGNGPSSRSEPLAPAQHSTPTQDRPVDPAGQKSVRGAPNGGHEPDDDVPETDIKALLRKEMRKAV